LTLDEFLERLDGVRPAGNGFVANCPGHEDREASLGVTEGDDGRILLNCYAGCETKYVVEAMELPYPHALFPARRSWNDEFPEHVYEYQDELGQPLFEALRYPGKKFRQRHHDPENPDAKADGYVYNLEGVRRVMFRLPELIRAVAEGKTIYVTEGEKDALRITSETGRFATCNPMGAGKWREEYAQHFRGAKRVFIIQDRDDPGRRHAQKVKAALEAVGVPEVTIWQAKTGKDISDHFDAGHAMEELVRPRAVPKRGIVTVKEMIESGLEYLQYRPQDLPGWELIEGIEASTVRPGRLYAWGAYTGDGKTTSALQGTRRICELGIRGGYFSMEMSEVDLRNRLIAHEGVPMRLLERPWELHQNPEMLRLYKEALEKMSEWKLDIIYDTQLKVERIIEDTIDREYEFVVLDHIHRLSFGDRRDLEEKIKQLTNLTLDANIPMLVLCQLRRYQRGKDMVAYPPPLLQDFRETEVLGNEASIAAALWRQRDQEGLRYVGTQSQFRVLKNRHTTGRKDRGGHIEMLDFDPVTQLFTPGGINSGSDQGDAPAWGEVSSGLDPDDRTWE
jgi:hypothetical protein